MSIETASAVARLVREHGGRALVVGGWVRDQLLGRLVPIVHAEVEGAPVNRQERLASEELERRQRVLRAEVDVAPVRMKRADLEHDEIEGAEAIADLLVDGREPRVAAEEHRVSVAPDDE